MGHFSRKNIKNVRFTNLELFDVFKPNISINYVLTLIKEVNWVSKLNRLWIYLQKKQSIWQLHRLVKKLSALED